jgi:outer membrane protein assembly factor BamB
VGDVFINAEEAPDLHEVERAAFAAPRPDVARVAQLAHGLFGSSSAWRQFHGVGSSAGVALRHTAPAVQRMWRREVGPVLASSPVIDDSGFVYLGTSDGWLVRVTPDGSVLRRALAGGLVYGPVAVGIDGSVYAITQLGNEKGADVPFRCRLVKHGPGLVGEWAIDLPEDMMTTGAPKLWEREDGTTFVFVHVGNANANELLVFDSGGEIRARSDRLRCTRPIVGSGFDFNFSDLWDWLVLDPPQPAGPKIPPPSPTPAIFEAPHLLGSGRVVVVTADGVCAIRGFDFDGRNLEERWGRGHDLDVAHASPAVIAGGLVVIGNDDGTVLGLDVLSGTQLWQYDAGEYESVIATAASFVRPIFVVSRSKLHALDSNGSLMEKVSLPIFSFASPAVSADWVYVAESGNLLSYSLAGVSSSTRDGTCNGGLLTPAIGPDGTVVAVHDHRELWAYPPPGSQ